MVRAQLPTSEALSQQVSQELDTQLPSKITRLQEEMEMKDSVISVIPRSSCAELKQSTQQQQQQRISQQEQGEITETPISAGSAITIQIAQPQHSSKSNFSNMRDSGDPFLWEEVEQHNMSKSFKPHLVTIIILSVGTKVIPK